MTVWYRSHLLAPEALSSAKASLENARGIADRRRALKYCKDALMALRRIDTDAVTTDQSTLKEMAIAYRDISKMLETWNESEKAQKCFNKAKELEIKALLGRSVHSAAPIRSQSPTPPQSTVVLSYGSSPVLPPPTSTSELAVLSLVDDDTTISQVLDLIPSNMGDQDDDLDIFDSCCIS